MKKTLIAAALLAVGAGTYWYAKQHQGADMAANAVLEYIPADTPVFSGQLTPFPLKTYLQSISGNYQQASADALPDLQQVDDPIAKFFLSIYLQYMAGLGQPSQLLSTFGLADEIQPYFYTLGAVPVLKMNVQHIAAWWAVLDKAEQDSGLSHELRQHSGIDYRAYGLSEAANPDKAELIFAYHEGMLTVTLLTAFNDPVLIDMALGLKKPSKSLADSAVVQDIINTHGFRQDSISFINHVEIVKALTAQDSNLLARQLTHVFADAPALEDPLAQLRTPQCQRELTAIATNWPRTVAGLTALSVTEQASHVAASVVVETKNQPLLTALQKLRGFLPAHLANMDSTLFSIGLGLDMQALAPSLTAIWDELQQPALSCEPLAQWQGLLREQNPAMLGMFTGMANGVKGMSVALLDYQMQEQAKEPQLASLDALVSLSADNPAMLVNMLKPFVPMLAEVPLASDGAPTDLSPILMLPADLPIKPMLAIKGQHLVVYTGDKSLALANTLASEPLTANGLYRMSADYGKMLTPLLPLLELSGEPIPPELQQLKDYNMRVHMSVDVNPQGLVFGSVVNSQAGGK
ncbi:MAG: hypothetical protein ACRDA8_04995 [Shewanella sp.]